MHTIRYTGGRFRLTRAPSRRPTPPRSTSRRRHPWRVWAAGVAGLLGLLGALAAPAGDSAEFAKGLAAFDAANRSKEPRHEGYAQAYAIWSKLARDGHSPSQYHVGILHWYGLGGADFDQARGFRLVRRSAEAGYRQAQSYMGVLHENGDGTFTRRDDQTALDWYRLAGNAGHCYAIRRLVRAHRNGELGLAADAAKADAWALRKQGCHPR